MFSFPPSMKAEDAKAARVAPSRDNQVLMTVRNWLACTVDVGSPAYHVTERKWVMWLNARIGEQV